MLKGIDKKAINCFVPIDYNGLKKWDFVSQKIFDQDIKGQRPLFRDNYQYDKSSNFPFQFKAVRDLDSEQKRKRSRVLQKDACIGNLKALVNRNRALDSWVNRNFKD